MNEDTLRELFLNKVRGQIKHWSSQDITTDAKFDGLAESFLEIIDNEYILAPIDIDLEVVLPTISGGLKERYLREDNTVDSNQDEFIEHLKELKEYWKSFGEERGLGGFIFSALVILDGGTALPPYYFVSKDADDIQLAGCLHEVLH